MPSLKLDLFAVRDLVHLKPRPKVGFKHCGWRMIRRVAHGHQNQINHMDAVAIDALTVYRACAYKLLTEHRSSGHWLA